MVKIGSFLTELFKK